MRLIDADALKKALPVKWDTAMKAIDDAPTIDAVTVVRCRDCKWRNKDDDCTHEWWRDAEGWDKYVEDDDFCSYGERRRENV